MNLESQRRWTLWKQVAVMDVASIYFINGCKVDYPGGTSTSFVRGCVATGLEN